MPGNLGQACQAGFDFEALAVAWYLVLEGPDGDRTVRTRPDNRHFPDQDVEKLGKFVKTGLAENPAKPGDTRIIGTGLERTEFLLCVFNHGAKFVDLVDSARQGDSFLGIESWSL